MISISAPIKNLKQSDYYLRLADVNYYAGDKELPGSWIGRGAELLGLNGRVEPQALRNLFDGFSPDGQRKLVQNAGAENRQRATDLAVGPPKSFSVACLLGSPARGERMRQLHREALASAVDFLEREAGWTRRGKAGRDLERAHLVIACFEHETSRADDPQLHTHLLVLNTVVREDLTTGTLANHQLFALRAKADMIYKVHLAMGLALDLGLQLEQFGNSFEIRGVPKEVCDAFSQRRKAIIGYLGEEELKSPGAGRMAALATRPEKSNRPTDELRIEWRKVAEDLGWNAEHLEKLFQDGDDRRLAARLFPLANLGDREPGPRESASVPIQVTPNRINEEALPVDARRTPSPVQAKATTEASESLKPASPARIADPRSQAFTQNKTGNHRLPRGFVVPPKHPRSWFRQVRRQGYELSHPRWGDILWQADLGFVELRVQKRRLSPRALDFNPMATVAVPAIRIIPWRLHLIDMKLIHARKRGTLLWKKSLWLAELRLEKRALVPWAPRWSPVHNLEVLRLRVTRRTNEVAKTQTRKRSQALENPPQNTQTHSP